MMHYDQCWCLQTDPGHADPDPNIVLGIVPFQCAAFSLARE